jgi:hypothetical protein
MVAWLYDAAEVMVYVEYKEEGGRQRRQRKRKPTLSTLPVPEGGRRTKHELRGWRLDAHAPW